VPAVEAVCKARRVGEQVSDRDRALERNGLVVTRIASRIDDHAGKLRHELGRRRLHDELPFFVQHHGRHAGDWLGHGEDAKDGVLRHRTLRLAVHQPMGLKVGDLAVAGDQSDHPRQAAGVDMSLHGLTDASQPVRTEPEIFQGTREHGSVPFRASRQCGVAQNRPAVDEPPGERVDTLGSLRCGV